MDEKALSAGLVVAAAAVLLLVIILAVVERGIVSSSAKVEQSQGPIVILVIWAGVGPVVSTSSGIGKRSIVASAT